MRNKTFDFDPDATDADGLVTIASISGAGALTLNGALVTGGVGVMDYARRIAILSAGNDSGDTMTIVGTDADGVALTEVLTMANADTAESTGYFKTVTSLTASGASAGNVTIGVADEFQSQTIVIDARSPYPCTIDVDVTGTITWTVQEMFDSTKRADLQNAKWRDIDGTTTVGALEDMASIVNTDVIGVSSVGAKAIRFVVESFTDTAEAQMRVSQPLGC
jgi:hypothetical protein